MLMGARRLPLRRPQDSARRARLALRGWIAGMALCLGALPGFACEAITDGRGLATRSAEVEFLNRKGSGDRHENWAPGNARLILHAGFDDETDEYDHGVLGPLRDTKTLTIHVRLPGDDRITCPVGVTLPVGQVFEDSAPRLADLDADGLPEIIVVQTSTSLGARLAVYDRRANLLAATPYIGTSRRWLAPLGAADLDGDGAMDLAYIDRPHLAKTLRVWRYENRSLREIASLPGLTNHHFGEDHISGGIRDCGKGAEIITADAGWRKIMATRLRAGKLETREIADFQGPASLRTALICP